MGHFLQNTWRVQTPFSLGGDAAQPIKGIVGWGGLALADRQLNIVSLLKAYLKAVQEESCGRCAPCRLGSRIMLDIISRISLGQGSEADLAELERLGRVTGETSLCEFGRCFPVPVLDALRESRADFLAVLREGKPLPEGSHQYQKVIASPCTSKCPAKLDIPLYIRDIKESCFEKALATIRNKTFLAGTLGRVCGGFCENGCRRQHLEAPLNSRCLKRFAADYERNLRRKPVFSRQQLPERVAVVGAGPAGLNAAYLLSRKGYRVTVFEAGPEAGGMLVSAFPEYRLPGAVVEYELEIVKGLGVEIRTNTPVGQEIKLEDLWKQGFKALLVATGLQQARVPENLTQVKETGSLIEGLQFLKKSKRGEPMEVGPRVAVIGAGHMALDCARIAIRGGAQSVHLISPEPRAKLAEARMELGPAEEEGVHLHFVSPFKVASGQTGKTISLIGDGMDLTVDSLIYAGPLSADLSFLNGNQGLKTKNGLLEADLNTMETALPGVFACGDVVAGEGTVVGAVASANRAATSIDQYLRFGRVYVQGEGNPARLLESLGIDDPGAVSGFVGGRPRQETEELDVKVRTHNFDEIETGLQPGAALKESERCLRCSRMLLIVR